MIINGVSIGEGQPPYVVAEMSANHNGRLETAYEIMDMAARCGANAIKLQTYTADTITLKSQASDFMISGGLWDGMSLYELYDRAHLPWEWHEEIFRYAKQKELTVFSSPFSFEAVDLLESLDCPAYKIASFEAIDLPLIEYCASTGKPLIISTGLASLEEMLEARDAALGAGCGDLVMLHCVSAYPSLPGDYNLATITDMREKLGVPIGLSDHTLSNTTAIASIALGACFIEKHVTLDRSAGGPDDSFSLVECELKALVDDSRVAFDALGEVDYSLKSSEKGNIQFRRSIYFVSDLREGDIITEDDIRSVRPGYGVPPKFFKFLLGRKMTSNVKKNTPVHLDLIDTG